MYTRILGALITDDANALKTYLQNLVTIWKIKTSKSMKTVWQSHDIATSIKVRL